MKSLVSFLLLLTILCFAGSTPAFANPYSNGPTNGTINSFFIDVYAVSDSFTVSTPSGPLFSFLFAEWVPTGATPLTVDWSIGTTSFGADIGSGTGQIDPQLLCTNGQPFNGGICGGGLGYDVYRSIVQTGNLFVPTGTFWLTLTNATDSFGGRDGWDINSGPSMAYHNLLGQVPSESFTVNIESTTLTGTTPEPSSIILLGSGILTLANVVRRKFL